MFGLSSLPPSGALSGGLLGHGNLDKPSAQPISASSIFAQPPTEQPKSVENNTVSSSAPTGGLFKPQETSAPVQNQEKPALSSQQKLEAFFAISKNPQPQPVT